MIEMFFILIGVLVKGMCIFVNTYLIVFLRYIYLIVNNYIFKKMFVVYFLLFYLFINSLFIILKFKYNKLLILFIV